MLNEVFPTWLEIVVEYLFKGNCRMDRVRQAFLWNRTYCKNLIDVYDVRQPMKAYGGSSEMLFLKKSFQTDFWMRISTRGNNGSSTIASQRDPPMKRRIAALDSSAKGGQSQ